MEPQQSQRPPSGKAAVSTIAAEPSALYLGFRDRKKSGAKGTPSALYLGFRDTSR